MTHILGKSSLNSTHQHYIDIFDTWTEVSAYLLGYLEADGTIVNKGQGICFATSIKDQDYLEQLKALTGFTGKTTVKIHHLKTGQYKTCTFTISSKQWLKALVGKLRIGKIPIIPEEFLRHYTRGYFDGDGSIYFDNQVKDYKSSFVFGNKRLAGQFRDLFLKIGLKVSNIHRKTNSEHCWYFQFGNVQTSKLGAWMYRNGSIYLKRKRILFDQSLANHGG